MISFNTIFIECGLRTRGEWRVDVDVDMVVATTEWRSEADIKIKSICFLIHLASQRYLLWHSVGRRKIRGTRKWTRTQTAGRVWFRRRVEWGERADAVAFNEHRNTMATNRKHALLMPTIVCVCCVCALLRLRKTLVPSRGEMFVDFYAYSNKHYYYYCTQITSDTRARYTHTHTRALAHA